MTKHDSVNKDLAKRIKEEKVVFLDQFGKFHKVFNNCEKEIVLLEASYNYETNETSPTQLFRGLTQSERVELVKDTLTPDISVIKDGQYTYWIEGVNTHPCTDYKMSKIQTSNFTTLEFSIFDYNFKENRRVIPCFNISNITADEYEIIKKYYKERVKEESFYDYLITLFMGASTNNKIKEIDVKLKAMASVRSIKKTKEKVIKAERKSKRNNPQIIYPEVFQTLHVIIDKAMPKLQEGYTLCANGLVDRCLDGQDIIEDDRESLIKRIKYVIRKEHKLSIYYFSSEHYFDETITKFNLKRRESILLKDLGEEIRDFNSKLTIKLN